MEVLIADRQKRCGVVDFKIFLLVTRSPAFATLCNSSVASVSALDQNAKYPGRVSRMVIALSESELKYVMVGWLLLFTNKYERATVYTLVSVKLQVWL
jgi:hypothetical protein